MGGRFLRNAAACALFLAAWGIFCAGASPAPYGGDAGELGASAVALGVSHSPGYPLHSLAGKAFAAAVPWGGSLYRVNALSALLTALTVAGLFLWIAAATASGAAGFCAAVVYAGLPAVWDGAQTAEVFSLNNALCLAIFALLWRGGPAPAGPRRTAAAAFLFGLALANHQTALFCAPAFLWLALRHEPRWWRSVTLSTVFCAAGLSLYFYLFLRAGRHPPVNFGDPHTWKRFFAVLTRKEFGSLELHPAALPFRTWLTCWELSRGFVLQNLHQFGIVAAATVAVISLRLRRPGALAVALLASWVFSGPLFFLLSNLSPYNTLAQWRMERFLLLPCLIIAAALGLRSARLPRAALAVGLALFVAERAWAAPHPWFRWNLAFRDFGTNVLRTVPRGGAFLIDRVLFDEPTSCLLAVRVAEGRRQDVRFLYRPGTLFELFYGEDVLELSWEGRARRQREREDALWGAQGGPEAALAFVKENLPRPMTASGLAYRAVPSPASPGIFYARRDLRMEPARDYPTRLILVHYPYMEAKAAFERGDAESFARFSTYCGAVGRGMEWLLSNLGSLWSRRSASAPPSARAALLDRAEESFRRAAQADPYFPQAQFGLGYAAFQKERFLEAAARFASAERVKPGWGEACYMEGLSYRSAGDLSRAREAWERFLAMDPGSPLAEDVRKALR